MFSIEGLTTEIVLLIGILLLTTCLFLSETVRVDLTALLVLVLLGMFKILPANQLFSGFSSEAVISLIAIMIITKGMENSGISIKTARWVLDVGQDKPKFILLLLMGITGIIASFMRSLGTVALFLPVINRITVRSRVPKSYLLMPMAFCSILGGMLTMVGTGPLIILNSLLRNASHYGGDVYMQSVKPFGLFAVLPIGLMLLLSGIIYFLIIGDLLVKKDDKSDSLDIGTTKSHFLKCYGKGGSIFELKVLQDSNIVGGTVKDIEILLPSTCSLLAVKQAREIMMPPLRGTNVKSNSVLAIMGEKEKVIEFAKLNKLKVYSKLNVFSELLHPMKSGLCEVVIPPGSKIIGSPVNELHMRRNYSLQVLALNRGSNVLQGDELINTSLRSGDTLGMYSNWEALTEFQHQKDFFVLTSTFPHEKVSSAKIPQALAFFALSIGCVLFGGFPTSIALLFGAACMIVTGVVSMDEAYSSISWKTVFLLAGLMPLGLAIQKTGTVDWLMNIIVPEQIVLSNWILLSILAVLSTMLALVISNIGATVLLVPFAMDLASIVAGDPRIFALAVALGASNTFLIPTHQVNALVAGPGGYSLKDFIYFGGWMTIIYWIIIIIGLSWFY